METSLNIAFTKLSVRHSDPTYEAWKRINRSGVINPPSPYSDPTYEAWKRSWFKGLIKRASIIPILPMRHGNHNVDTG